MGQTINNKAIQTRIMTCLEKLQILTQNNAVTMEQKKLIVQELQKSRKTNDMSEVNKIFRRMSYGTTFPEIIDELVELTS